MKVIKNTTGVAIELTEVGLTVPALGQIILNEMEYSLVAFSDSITEITPYLNSGDLVVNNGSIDLSAEEGIRYLSLSENPIIYENGVVKARYVKDLDFIEGATVVDSGSGRVKLSVSGKKAELVRNFYVSKNGNDSTADGSITYPFLTINACITYINSNYTLSATSNAVIRVAAGEYTENTIVLPAFCSIWGHHYRTRIKHSTGLDDLIQSAGSHTIKGLLLTGVTAIDKYLIRISTASAKRVTLQDLSLSTYEVEGTVSNGVYLTSTAATTVVRMKQIDFNDIDGTLIYLNENVKVVARGAQIFTCPTATFVNAYNNSSYSIYNVDIDSINIGINHQNTGTSDISNIDLLGANIPIIKSNTSNLFMRSVLMNTLRAQITNYDGLEGYFTDTVTGDKAFRVINELSVGTSDHGHESVFGEGDSYTIGMNVYTSDGTDTSTTEGNLTDVSDVASSKGSEYFSFQGTGSNYCIYVSTDVQNDSWLGTLDYARTMGIKIAQTTACVEPIEKSIVFESWTGSVWEEGSVMASESSLFYPYSNDLFIRANSSEHIRYGRNLIDPISKKLIAGKERFWTRLRIKNPVTVAPVFDQFKISTNRTEINADGTITMHGLARFLVALNFQSNTFGETGGVTNANFTIGNGGIDFPHDSWNHTMKNNQLNGDNDAIYANALIPEGCCTSCPLQIKMKYVVLNSGASPNGELKVSMYIVKTSGVKVADRSGGITPIFRPTSEATDFSTGVAQVRTLSIQLDTSNKVLTAPSASYDIDDYYEGDLLFIRVGLNDSGNNKKIAILGIDVEYIKWTLGTKL